MPPGRCGMPPPFYDLLLSVENQLLQITLVECLVPLISTYHGMSRCGFRSVAFTSHAFQNAHIPHQSPSDVLICTRTRTRVGSGTPPCKATRPSSAPQTPVSPTPPRATTAVATSFLLGHDAGFGRGYWEYDLSIKEKRSI